MNFRKKLLASSIGLASAALTPVVGNAVTISTVRSTSGTTTSFSLDSSGFIVTNSGSIDLTSVSFASDILLIPFGSTTANIEVQAGGSLLATPSFSITEANAIAFDIGAAAMTGNITNSGTIVSDRNAIFMQDGSLLVGDIINNAGASILGNNDSSGPGSAIRIEQLTNPSLTATTATGGLANRPVLQGSISNAGTIDSGSGPAILVYVGEITGDIDNGVGTGGTIDGIDISSSLVGGGILNDGTASSITGGIQIHEDTQTTVNHASIVAGGITNSGTIDGGFGPALSIYNNGQLQGGLTNNASGVIQNTSGTVIELFTGGTITGGVTNSGVIGSSGSFGSAIRVSGAGSSITGGINNNAGGLIDSNSGTVIGFDSGATLTGGINNTGTISSNSFGSAINVSGAGTVITGGINNNLGGVISAAGGSSSAVIDINGGAAVDAISNAGTISQTSTFTSAPAIRVSGGTVSGSITNSGSITSDREAIILDGNSVVGSIVNSTGGLISSSFDDALVIGDFFNSATILSSGISNDGTIESTGGNAIFVGGTISSGGIANNGIIESIGTIESGGAGILLENNGSITGNITNSGTISSDTHGGIEVVGSSSLNGSIINNAGATIETSSDRIGAIFIFGGDTSNSSLAPSPVVTGSIQNTGTIQNLATTATSGPAAGIWLGMTDLGGSISNNGTIQSASGFGLYLQGYQADPQAPFTTALDATRVTGDITNSGTIQGALIGALLNGSEVGGDVINQSGGSIQGALGGLVISSNQFLYNGFIQSTSSVVATGLTNVTGDITNSGTIQATGATGTGLSIKDAEIGGSIANNATGQIEGPNGGLAIISSNVGGAISNAGTINSDGPGVSDNLYGVDIQFSTIGGGFTNTGTITGGFILDNSSLSGALDNSATGTITAAVAGGDAVVIRGGSSSLTGITNAGTLSGGAGISVEDDAIVPVITNSGSITGSGAGIIVGSLSFPSTAVSSIVNNVGGTITGGTLGAIVAVNGGTIGSVSNAGTISGVLDFGANGGTFTNTGGSAGNIDGADSVTISGGAVGDILNADSITISGGSVGDIALIPAATFAITGGSAGNVSNLQSDLTNGGSIASVAFSAAGFSVTNTGTIGGNLSGLAAVTNSGTLGDVALQTAGGSFNSTAGVVGNVSNVAGASTNDGTVGNVSFTVASGSFDNTGVAGDVLGANAVTNTGDMGDVTLVATGGTFTNGTGTAGDISNVTGTSTNAGTLGTVSFVAGGGIFNNSGDVAALTGSSLQITNSGTIGGNLVDIHSMTNSGTVGDVSFDTGVQQTSSPGNNVGVFNAGTLGSFTSTAGTVGDITGASSVNITGGAVGDVTLSALGGTFTISGGSAGAVSNISGDLTNAGTLASVAFASPGSAVTNSGTISADLLDVSAVDNSGTLQNVSFVSTGGALNNTGTIGNVSNVTGTAFNDITGTVGNVAFTGSGSTFLNSGSAGTVTGASFVFNDGGTVGDVTLLANGIYGAVAGTSGTISNATSIDILTGQNTGEVVSTINGDLTFSGVLTMQADGTASGITNYSKLDVTGNANLNGASVFVLATGIQNFQLNDSFTFLEAGGTLTSDITNFSACDVDSQDTDCETPLTELTVVDSSQPLEFKVVQVGSTLQAVIGDIDFTPVIQPVDQGKTGTKNVTNLAGALNTIVLSGADIGGTSLGNVTNSLAQVDVSTPEGQQQYARALSSLDPDTIEGAAAGALSADAVAASTIDNRVSALRGFYGFSGAVAGDPLAINGFWVQGYDNETDQDERDGTDGFDADTYGVALGVDAPWGEDKILGAAISYADTDVGMKQNSGNGMDISSLRLSLYGSYNTPNYYFDGQLAYAMNNYESTRVVDPLISGGSSLVAKGDHDGDQYNVRVRAGYPMAFDSGWFITPKAEFNYTLLSEDDFSEKGAGNAGLDISTDDMEVLVIGLGAKFAYPWTSENDVTWIPELSIDYMYDTIGDEVEVDSNFVGVTGAAFITEGANVEQEAIKVGLKLRVFSQGKFSFAGGYDYVTKQDYESHSLSATVRYDF